jgi:hypothetical protein
MLEREQILLYNPISKPFAFLSFEVTVGKLKVAKSVTSAVERLLV